MTHELLPSPNYLKQLKKWVKRHAGSKEKIAITLERLAKDVSEPSLETHKLQGKLNGCWACSVDTDLRIVFEYVEHEGKEVILLVAIGTHDEVYY